MDREKIEAGVRLILEGIGEDPEREGLLETPERIARMYEELAGGFRKKFLGLCFITTAVCLREGKPDDCAELTAFRAFRDGYLRACPDGPALIDEYYDIAPGIVLRIDLSRDREARYDAIRENWLEPCYADLRAGNLHSCKERYVEMVRSLEKEYLS